VDHLTRITLPLGPCPNPEFFGVAPYETNSSNNDEAMKTLMIVSSHDPLYGKKKESW
jgi:hypothetical protein